jgi:hypothetical protein
MLWTSASFAADGDILFKQCVTPGGSAGACTSAPSFANAWKIAVAPGGKTAYVSYWQGGAGAGGGGLVIYDRDPATGKLTPRSGAANCYRATPNSGDCTAVRGMTNPLDVQISPDGAHVYVAGWGSSSIAVFDRNQSTGQLTQKAGTAGCIANGVAGCAPGRALTLALNLFPSPDFHNIYATAQTGGGAIAILTVQSDGSLSQVQGIDGCVTENGSDGAGNACTDGTAIGIEYQLSVSPDGRHVYAASSAPQAVALFNRDTTTGALTQKSGLDGCISQNGYPDASNTPRCRTQASITSPLATRITPDGKYVYVLGSSSIVAFSRASSNGLLTFQSCVNEAGTGGCADGRGVSSLQYGAISPDGTALVAKNSAGGGGGMSFFDIGSNGNLTQRAGVAGCATNDGSTPSGAGQCRVVPQLGGEGTVDFPSNVLLDYGGFSSSAAVVFDRDYAPVCQPTTVSIPNNAAASIAMPCSDINNDAITYSIVSQPSAGALAGSIDQATGSIFYNPFQGYVGADSFTFRATARGVQSNVATATLKVQATSSPPPVIVPSCVDNDHDGFCVGQDCNDNDPKIRPGALEIKGNRIDENCDGIAEPFPTLTSSVASKWNVKGSSLTMTSLVLSALPSKWTAVIKCSGKKCPFKTKALKGKVKKGSADVTKSLSSKQRKFRAKQTIEVWVSAPNFNTKVARLALKAGKIPSTEPLCVIPGGAKPQKICT